MQNKSNNNSNNNKWLISRIKMKTNSEFIWRTTRPADFFRYHEEGESIRYEWSS